MSSSSTLSTKVWYSRIAVFLVCLCAFSFTSAFTCPCFTSMGTYFTEICCEFITLIPAIRISSEFILNFSIISLSINAFFENKQFVNVPPIEPVTRKISSNASGIQMYSGIRHAKYTLQNLIAETKLIFSSIIIKLFLTKDISHSPLYAL